VTTGGIAGIRARAPERVEGYDDKEIHDRQLRIAAWFVKYEGVDAGTRSNRKRLNRETIDDIRPVFQMLGLGVITDDSGLWDLIEAGKFVPLHKQEEAAEAALIVATEPEPEPEPLEDVIPEPYECSKHLCCTDCGHCVCRDPNTRVRKSPGGGAPLCAPCRKARRKKK
jgi:hypothetical protein